MAMGGGGSGEGGLSIRRRELPPGFGVPGEDRSLGAGCIWLVHGLYPGSGMGWGGGEFWISYLGKGHPRLTQGTWYALYWKAFVRENFFHSQETC